MDVLVERAQGGDRLALAQLVERHQAKVYSLALAITRNPNDAADMTQETFVKMLRSLGTYRGDAASFSTWLHRLTVNTCLDAMRRNRRAPVSIDLTNEDAPARELASEDHWLEPEWRAVWRESAIESVPRSKNCPGAAHRAVAALLRKAAHTTRSRRRCSCQSTRSKVTCCEANSAWRACWPLRWPRSAPRRAGSPTDGDFAIEFQRRVRVLVADDDIHVRSALRLLLEQEADVQVVGESTRPKSWSTRSSAATRGWCCSTGNCRGLRSNGLLSKLRTLVRHDCAERSTRAAQRGECAVAWMRSCARAMRPRHYSTRCVPGRSGADEQPTRSQYAT